MSQLINISTLMSKLAEIVGKSILQPKTKNKGEVGLLLETLTGIPHTSNCLDCLDGELKVFPVKRLKNGTIVPKETMAITMLCPEDLKKDTFENSKVLKKMNRMLCVPYERDGDNVTYMEPTLIDLSTSTYEECLQILKKDYSDTCEKYIRDGTLKSETGILLQNRTKGPGHGSTSRAFYLRPAFMKKYVLTNS